MQHRSPTARRPAARLVSQAGEDTAASSIDPAGGSAWLQSENDLRPQRISKDEAALLLTTETALGGLSVAEARRVVDYMEPKRLRPGTSLIRQGERHATHFMALVLDGTVQVVSCDAQDRPSQVLGVLGPGAVIGEMSLVDGDARSASCVALGHVGVGMLTRKALWRMIDKEPALAARLVLILMRHVTRRMRETTRRLKVMAQLNDALRSELRERGPVELAEPAPDRAARELYEAEQFAMADTVKLKPNDPPD